MKVNLTGKIALVTGGSSGIGLSTAKLLAQSGAHVWLLARRLPVLQDALQVVASSSSSAEQRFDILVADVSSQEQVNAAIEQMRQQIGLPDIVINSAGATYPGYFEHLEIDIFRQLIDVNYFGTVYVIKAVLPGMLARGSGHIVNICSIGGVIGMIGYTAYAGSKFAMRGFSDSLRAELKLKGIDMSLVIPPDTNTPQLAWESSFRPQVLNVISSLDEAIEPEVVARDIIQGMQRKQYMILPGAGNKFWFWVNSLLGTRAFWLLDVIVAWAVRKVQKSAIKS